MDKIYSGNGSRVMDESYIGTERELMQEARWAEEHVADDEVPPLEPGVIERIWERIMRERGN